MLVFDIDFSEDDLRVLSAYARAQDNAETARKSQLQDETAITLAAGGITLSAVGIDEADAFDGEPSDEEGASSRDSKPVSRRIHTWISRLREVEGVPHDRLAPIHGRLIAHGLLQFQLQGREDGVMYRVTSAGRQMLNTPNAEAA